jgi:hypothetical protein
MFPQFLKIMVADCGRCPRDLVGKMNDCLVFFVEEFAAMVKGESVDLFLGDADPLRRSGMCLGSILAAIDDRGLQIGEFFVSVIQGAGPGGCGIERKKGLEDFRLVGHHAKEVGHASKLLLHAFVNRFQIIGRFLFRQRLHDCHKFSPCVLGS